MGQVIGTIKFKKGIVETVYDAELRTVYLRTFIGKGAKEVCYKSKPGDCDIDKFAIAVGYEKAI